MANIGVSSASSRAVTAVRSSSTAAAGHMSAIASNRSTADHGGLSAKAAMRDNLFLDVSAVQAGIKSMSVALGYLETANNTLDNASNIISRVYELSILAANDTNTSQDSANIDAEIETLMDHFHRVMSETNYKGKSIFQDSPNSLQLNTGQQNTSISFGLGKIDYDDLYDHVGPSQNTISPSETYTITDELSDEEKAAILAKTTGLSADDLIPGFEFTTDEVETAPPIERDVAAVDDTSSIGAAVTNMGLLENMLVKAGVNATAGTLGSGGNTAPGLQFDGTGAGAFNDNYDYLTPGSPFDGFAIKVDGSNAVNNNTGVASYSQTSFEDLDDSLVWTGTDTNGWTVKHSYTLGETDSFIDIKTEITAGSNATLSFGRFIDPDARAASGDSSATDNVIGYGSIPENNIVFSEALSSRYALGLYSTDANVTSGIASPWSSEADGYDGTPYDGDVYGSGDDAIGLSWNFGDVTVGETVTANYAYTFGIGAYEAASGAYEGGAGGGRDVTGGVGVLDVGSATDAAQTDFAGKLALVPTNNMALSASSASQQDNAHVVTSKIEALQQKLNLARVEVNAKFAVIESALDTGTDLRSEYSKAMGAISDVNFSREAAALAKEQMLQQASTAVLTQANGSQKFLLDLVV